MYVSRTNTLVSRGSRRSIKGKKNTKNLRFFRHFNQRYIPSLNCRINVINMQHVFLISACQLQGTIAPWCLGNEIAPYLFSVLTMRMYVMRNFLEKNTIMYGAIRRYTFFLREQTNKKKLKFKDFFSFFFKISIRSVDSVPLLALLLFYLL